MDTKLFDGKALAQKIEAELKSKNKTPKLHGARVIVSGVEN